MTAEDEQKMSRQNSKNFSLEIAVIQLQVECSELQNHLLLFLG